MKPTCGTCAHAVHETHARYYVRCTLADQRHIELYCAQEAKCWLTPPAYTPATQATDTPAPA